MYLFQTGKCSNCDPAFHPPGGARFSSPVTDALHHSFICLCVVKVLIKFIDGAFGVDIDNMVVTNGAAETFFALVEIQLTKDAVGLTKWKVICALAEAKWNSNKIRKLVQEYPSVFQTINEESDKESIDYTKWDFLEQVCNSMNLWLSYNQVDRRQKKLKQRDKQMVTQATEEAKQQRKTRKMYSRITNPRQQKLDNAKINARFAASYQEQLKHEFKLMQGNDLDLAGMDYGGQDNNEDEDQESEAMAAFLHLSVAPTSSALATKEKKKQEELGEAAKLAHIRVTRSTVATAAAAAAKLKQKKNKKKASVNKKKKGSKNVGKKKETSTSSTSSTKQQNNKTTKQQQK